MNNSLLEEISERHILPLSKIEYEHIYLEKRIPFPIRYKEHFLKVLRLSTSLQVPTISKQDNLFYISNGNVAKTYFDGKFLQLISTIEHNQEAPSFTLIQAISPKKAMENLVRQLTEIKAKEIIFFQKTPLNTLSI